MGIFLAVHGGENFVDKVLSNENLDAYESSLHIDYDSRSLAKSKNRQYGFIHYERNNAIYSSDEHTSIVTNGEEISVSLVQGYLWNKGSSDVINAKKLSKILEITDPEATRDRLTGEYSAIFYNENKRVFFAFNDRLSIEHIYYYRVGSKAVISNRIALIKEAVGISSPNLESLNWIGAVGNIVGDSTSEHDIHRLPQGSFIKIVNNEFELIRNDLYMIDKSFGEDIYGEPRSFFSRIIPSKKKSLNQVIDQGIEECAANVDLCLNYLNGKAIPLSGGKDSRAILALINSLGKTGEIEVVTNGFDEHSDVVVAKLISERYGLTQKRGIPKPPASIDASFIFNKLKGHVFQTDGMLGAWDAKGYTNPAGGLTLAGHIGEVYRGAYRFKNNDTDMDAVAKLLYPSNNLLNKASNDHYQKELASRLSFYLDNGAEPVDLPDVYFVNERTPSLVGALRRVDGYSSCLINPLNTETFIKLAYYLGDDQRKMERIHFEIINRLDPWLASLSFANDKWDSGLKEYAGSTVLSETPILTPSGLPQYGNWQHKIKTSDELVGSFLEVFTSFDNSPMWDYYDKSYIESKFINKDFKSLREMISAYGFINAFFYTHEIKDVMKLRVTNK